MKWRVEQELARPLFLRYRDPAGVLQESKKTPRFDLLQSLLVPDFQGRSGSNDT